MKTQDSGQNEYFNKFPGFVKTFQNLFKNLLKPRAGNLLKADFQNFLNPSRDPFFVAGIVISTRFYKGFPQFRCHFCGLPLAGHLAGRF